MITRENYSMAYCKSSPGTELSSALEAGNGISNDIIVGNAAKGKGCGGT